MFVFRQIVRDLRHAAVVEYAHVHRRTDELVKLTFAALKAGALEIRPGQSNQVAFMRRLAPI